MITNHSLHVCQAYNSMDVMAHVCDFISHDAEAGGSLVGG